MQTDLHLHSRLALDPLEVEKRKIIPFAAIWGYFPHQGTCPVIARSLKGGRQARLLEGEGVASKATLGLRLPSSSSWQAAPVWETTVSCCPALLRPTLCVSTGL